MEDDVLMDDYTGPCDEHVVEDDDCVYCGSRTLRGILDKARVEIDGLPAYVKEIFERNRQLRILADAQDQCREVTIKEVEGAPCPQCPGIGYHFMSCSDPSNPSRK